MTLWFLTLIIYFELIGAQQTQNPIVEAPKGKYEGSLMTTRLGRTIYSFRGIKYAQAPIGELRFQPPRKIRKHDGIYDAREDGPVCPHLTDDPSSEDCLVLNVYTTELPNENTNLSRPVIIFIHPGGFYEGTGRSNWVGPQYLMDKDIVLVTFNYRLGALGFLSTGEEEAPGNNGLKDQVVAMKWVKENIGAFGGDANSVTIFGYSAGSVSVMLHMMSPMSKGLFHKAIMGSASILGQPPIGSSQIDVAKRQARVLGCPDNSSTLIMNCLRGKSADEIGRSLPQLKEFGEQPVLLWKPVIEPDFGQERFLTDHPITLALQGKFQKLPVMAGITRDEFGHKAVGFIRNKTLIEELDKNWQKYAPIVFLYERHTLNSKDISDRLRKFYFKNGKLDNNSLTSLAQLFADSQTGWPTNRAVKLFASGNSKPVFYYKFSYQGKYSHYYYPESNKTIPFGVVHHDDLIYLFNISSAFPKFEKTDPESKMVDKLTTLYANFARTGTPIPEPSGIFNFAEWKPFNDKSEKYMDIGENMKMSSKLYPDRYTEWDRLFPYHFSIDPEDVTY